MESEEGGGAPLTLINAHYPQRMQNYLLYGEMSNATGRTLYKGRKKGTVQYCGLHKWSKERKMHISNEVSHVSHRLVPACFESPNTLRRVNLCLKRKHSYTQLLSFPKENVMLSQEELQVAQIRG